jgi:hypothetical protein
MVHRWSSDVNEFTIYATSTSLALLYANREAREIPLKVYEKAFATSLCKPVHFDFERDTVYKDLNTITISPQNCRIHSLMPYYTDCRES